MEFLFKPVKYNYSSRHGSKILFLVVHDTGNYSRGADALSHQRYFGGGNRNASAHYFVDDKRIVQIVGDSFSAWHCGDKWARKYATRSDVFNRNSIGIEMCMNSDSDYKQVYKNTLELVKNLMVKFNISASNVVRHRDASGKSCPDHMKKNNWDAWWQFKKDILKPIEYKMDLSKDSEIIIDLESELKNREDAVKKDPTKKFEFEEAKEKEMAELGKKFEMYENQAKEIEPSDWAKEDWERAIKLGLTDGSSPKRLAKREEVASMILRAMDNINIQK